MKRVVIIVLIILFVLCSIALGLSVYVYFNVKPVITILGDKEIKIKLGDDFSDPGVVVKINKKTINEKVKTSGSVDNTKVGTYIIKYEYKNKFLKNKAKAERNITVIDEDSPTIELKGKDKYTIYYTDSKDAKFDEPGYVATDNYDGDITDNVEVSSDVVFNKEGNYTITYKVKDSSLNETSVSRSIIVKKKVIVTTTSSVSTDGDNTSVTSANTGTGSGIAILMYHYFYSKENGDEAPNSNYMEVNDFENQIKYFKENGFYFPTWSEVRDFVDGKITLPSKSVVITMDDGHKSIYTYAIPILNKYEVPGTAFLMTVWETSLSFKNYSSPYINFQSHTHNMHRGGCSGGAGGLFRCINYDDGLKDLQTSISIVGSNDAIAYPFGDVTNNVLNITKAAGFKVGVTTVYGKAKKGMDPLRLPRIRMSKGMSLDSVKKAVS